MTKAAYLIAAACLLALSGCQVQARFESHPTATPTPAVDPAFPRPRFEEILSEGNDAHGFVVYHDREGGQEIACRRDNYERLACWPTGRNWK